MGLRARVLMSVIGVWFATELVAGPAAGDERSAPVVLDQSPGEAESLLTVIQLLETDIATKAVVQDADYAPGLVQVLRRADMEARGVRTVSEALNLVAGLDVPIDNLGIRQPVIRGFGGILSGATGKLKVLINGVSINSSQSATGSTLFEIPIGQIDRIEIIRGPGSAVYGEYAFLGVINVITRNDGRHVFLRYDSWETITGGGLWSYITPGGASFSLNVSGWETDGPDVIAGKDALYAFGQGLISNAPGPTNEARDDATVVFQADYGSLSFLAQYLDSGQGDHFGALFLPLPGDRIVFTNRWWTAEAKQVLNPTPASETRVKIGWQEFRNRFEDVVISPPGFLGIYSDGQTATTNHEERKLYAGAELVWNGLEKQTWLIGAEYADIDSFNDYNEQNFDPNNLIPGTPFPAPLPESQRFVGDLDDRGRNISSLFIQDQIEFNDQLAVTAGARFDHYSDVGDSLTPRVAAVYQPHERHIIKAQYAEAFRPPTFVELYSTATVALGNSDIDPETVKTTELSYIYKTPDTVLRTTVFHSDFEDLIVSQGGQFGNASNATVNGVDLELERQISNSFKVEANASYADTEDDATGQPLEGSADWIANLGLIYQPTPHFSLNFRYRFIDDRHRAPTDAREDLDSLSIASVTASVFDAGFDGVTFRFGAQNLFDESVKDPAPQGTYPDDFPRAGRIYWAQVSVEL